MGILIAAQCRWLTAAVLAAVLLSPCSIGAATREPLLVGQPGGSARSSGTGWLVAPGETAALDEPSAPFRIGGRPVFGAEGAFRASPSAAFDGTNYLVVWEEEREGALDIFAARVSRSGAVLDPEGIPVTSGPAAKARPSVAFDGINYLVVWSDSRGGSWDIYGARVSKGGAVLDPGGVAIEEAGGVQSNPSVAFSGSRYLVVWSDKGDGWVDIRGALLDVGGAVLGEEEILIAPSVARSVPEGPWGPSVAGDGSGFMVVWQTQRGSTWDVYGTRVSSSGEVLDPSGTVVSATDEEEWYPWIAYNGSNYFVVWHGVSGGSYDLFAARVGTDGTVLDAERIFVSEHRFWQRFPSVSSDGENYLVVWANWTAWSQDVYATLISSDGEVADILGAPVLHAETGIQWRPAVVYGGGNFLVISQDERSSSGGDIHGVLVDRSGKLAAQNDIGISIEGDGPWRPAVSFNGSSYTVVWGDTEDGLGRIAGARVSPKGALLDAAPVPISQEDCGAYAPDIAFDGAAHMVVWQDNRGGSWDIYGARLNRIGVVLDKQGVSICSEGDGQKHPSIAFGGGSYMVVWEDWRSGVWDIYGARVDPGGTVLDPKGLAISVSPGVQRHPSVAYDGTNFVVVWEDSRNGNWDIYGARVTPAGEVLDGSGVAVSTNPDDEWTPAVASDGANCFVVWHEWHGGSGDVLGAIVDPSGTVVEKGALTVCGSEGRQWAPDVAFNGREYVVAWSDARRGVANVNIYACRVAVDGTVLDPDGVGVSTDRDDQLLPSIAAGDRTEVLMVHSSFSPSSVFDYWRIWGSRWSPPEYKPLDLTVSIHQNPVLTSDLDVVLVPSKAVQDTSVWLMAGDTAIETALTDTAASIYRASYRLTKPGVIALVGGARDLLGIPATAGRQLGVGLVERSEGGTVAGPWGAISVRFPTSSVCSDSYVLVAPEETSSEFTISPPSLEMRAAALLRVRLEDGHAGPAPSLWRDGTSGWEEVESSYDDKNNTLTAKLTGLGRFKIVWTPGDQGRQYRSILLRTVPNPFHGSAEVRYMLPAGAYVEVRVYDATGRLVRDLFEGDRGPGWHGETWDGIDGAGRPLPGGVYFTVVRAGAEQAVGKCVLVR